MRKATMGPSGCGAWGKAESPEGKPGGKERSQKETHTHTPRQTWGCVWSGRVKGDRQKRQKETDGGGKLVSETGRDRKRETDRQAEGVRWGVGELVTERGGRKRQKEGESGRGRNLEKGQRNRGAETLRQEG